jgi:hypothetical protein
MLEHGLIVDFIKLWRQHFIDTMKPKQMPFMWEDYSDIYEKLEISHPSIAYSSIDCQKSFIR